MSSSRNQLRVTNTGGFITTYIPDEPYGEMNPKYVQDYFKELKERVILVDRSNNHRVVEFNGSAEHPMFITGWQDVGPFFGYPEHTLILMTYVGQSKFVVDFLPQPFDPNNLPSYHSYKYTHADPVSFQVELTKYIASGSQLTLSKEFASYVRASGFKKIRLYGPQGNEFKCKVLIRDGDKVSTKIGKGWLKFIDMNSFVKGDILKFQFANKYQSNLIKVTQLYV